MASTRPTKGKAHMLYFKSSSFHSNIGMGIFEYVEKMYPAIKARYKGLGSSAAVVSKEVIMDPKTRRLLRVTMDDAEIISTMGMLVGDGKENKNARKDMLMNFKFDMSMIDN